MQLKELVYDNYELTSVAFTCNQVILLGWYLLRNMCIQLGGKIALFLTHYLTSFYDIYLNIFQPDCQP